MELFSIGETARLNNISVKSLRHYDDIGLLKPKYVDSETNYRYYSYDQFPYIDRIKRFRDVGISLKELKTFFEEKDLGIIEKYLKEKQEELRLEHERLQQKSDNIELLLDFFQDSKEIKMSGTVRTIVYPERYILCVPSYSTDSIFALDMELRQVLSTKEFEHTQVLNPYGYLLDLDELLKNVFSPTHSTVVIRDIDYKNLPYVRKLPQGEYCCFHAKILSDNWNVDPLRDVILSHSKPPRLILANEYLKSFYNPSQSPYEIQILF